MWRLFLRLTDINFAIIAKNTISAEFYLLLIEDVQKLWQQNNEIWKLTIVGINPDRNNFCLTSKHCSISIK